MMENIKTPGMGVTTRIGCKNACSYCPQETLVRAYKTRSDVLEMSFDTFKKCLDKVPSKIPIYFAGMGEPWLNPECTNMVLYAYRQGHEIYVYTTLIGMNLSDVELLKTCSYECFMVHLPSDRGLENIKIDDEYLNMLGAIAKSGINVSYASHFGTVSLPVTLKIGSNVHIIPLNSRAANLKHMNIPLPNRKKGRIGCVRNLELFELLPNGDVALCCMDYGLKHVLGNLIAEDYNSLFTSPEFLKVKRGLADESLDILCRYCDGYSCDVDFSAKFYNRSLPRAVRRLKNMKDLKDILEFFRDCSLFLTNLIHKRY